MSKTNRSFDAHGDENRHAAAETLVTELVANMGELVAPDFKGRAAYIASDIRRIITEVTPAIRSAARIIAEGDEAVIALSLALAPRGLNDETLVAATDLAALLLGHRAIVDALADLETIADFELHLEDLREAGEIQ